MLSCPHCKSGDLRPEECDFAAIGFPGDVAECIRCTGCGALLDVEDLVELEETIQ